jgi:hypothetical protein
MDPNLHRLVNPNLNEPESRDGPQFPPREPLRGFRIRRAHLLMRSSRQGLFQPDAPSGMARLHYSVCFAVYASASGDCN